jgi:hypothetical protein
VAVNRRVNATHRVSRNDLTEICGAFPGAFRDPSGTWARGWGGSWSTVCRVRPESVVVGSQRHRLGKSVLDEAGHEIPSRHHVDVGAQQGVQVSLEATELEEPGDRCQIDEQFYVAVRRFLTTGATPPNTRTFVAPCASATRTILGPVGAHLDRRRAQLNRSGLTRSHWSADSRSAAPRQ